MRWANAFLDWMGKTPGRAGILVTLLTAAVLSPVVTPHGWSGWVGVALVLWVVNFGARGCFHYGRAAAFREVRRELEDVREKSEEMRRRNLEALIRAGLIGRHGGDG